MYGDTPSSTIPLASTVTISTPTSVFQYTALPAGQRGAADYHGCHRHEQPPVSDHRVGLAELRRRQDRGDAIEAAGQRESDDPYTLYRNP